MPEKSDNNAQKKDQGEFTGRAKGGYQPLHEGYQPIVSKKGYTPQSQTQTQGQGQSTELPKAPQGGTGQSGGKKETGQKS
jgi:hypothetical protein